MPESILFGVLFSALAAVLIVSAGVYVYRALVHRKDRTTYYHQWAIRHRMRYYPRDDSIGAMSSRAPFGISLEREGRDVFRGRYRDRHLVFGTYQHSVAIENPHANMLQVVAVSLPAPRPYLDITRETTGTGFLTTFGKRDLQLESQEFNDRFKIDTDNERFAYDVLSPQNMAWLLADVRANMYQYRFEGQWLMTMRPGELNLDEVFFYADFLHDLIDIVPRHVWQR